MKIALADENAQIEPVQTEGGRQKSVPEMDRLSEVLKTFNENFGTLFTNADRVAARIRDDIAPQVAADKAYQNAKENTPHTARLAHDQALMLWLLFVSRFVSTRFRSHVFRRSHTYRVTPKHAWKHTIMRKIITHGHLTRMVS